MSALIGQTSWSMSKASSTALPTPACSTSRRASIPRPRASAKVILGRGLKPWVSAIGTRARRSIRSRQRIRS